jgi:hypothetical protein
MRGMKTVILVLLLMLVAVGASSAQGPVSTMLTGRVSGQEFLELDYAKQRFWAIGFVDALYVADATLAPDPDRSTKYLSCVPKMSSTQIAEIVTRYIKDHPEKWQMPASFHAWNALVQACRRVDG